MFSARPGTSAQATSAATSSSPSSAAPGLFHLFSPHHTATPGAYQQQASHQQYTTEPHRSHSHSAAQVPTLASHGVGQGHPSHVGLEGWLPGGSAGNPHLRFGEAGTGNRRPIDRPGSFSPGSSIGAVVGQMPGDRSQGTVSYSLVPPVLQPLNNGQRIVFRLQHQHVLVGDLGESLKNAVGRECCLIFFMFSQRALQALFLEGVLF